mmetsp:Transcript_20230/g.65858  ORF Transcript_20230/g.65858 Transcript_20230/m.65858 type:complete len:160 (+) Transcript_20230:61-540(+)|eukprot:CAMPEP_0170143914 /NCGR_PEP_ID=MMETSP0033_2-20121228/13203_1 /TAXON_ID=195969 /ORGANISM="Dolichomastix tenuilepis, Strain CCMP3274" /LENGTH=159 /DNA_ID=CAMNT_0010380385 /DNA_START=48 /DNA_END=527 /DNA_ORIENTATION=+
MEDRPESTSFKILSGAASSAGIGALVGAVQATWNDVPAVMKGRAWPALAATLRVMGSYGMTFGFIGGAFAAGDAIAQDVRGKKDVWNGVIGGLAAGSVIGISAAGKRLPVGVGAAAALAATAAAVDTSGSSFRGTVGIADGQTPMRTYYPYPVATSKDA